MEKGYQDHMLRNYDTRESEPFVVTFPQDIKVATATEAENLARQKITQDINLSPQELVVKSNIIKRRVMVKVIHPESQQSFFLNYGLKK